MSRLILLAGVGGAGTSTLAAATVEQARGEGYDAVLVDGSGEQRAPSDVAANEVARALGPVLGLLGADPLAREGWSDLPGMRALSTLMECAAAVEEHDAVVVDVGCLVRARELAALPGVLLRLLDAALTPELAMARGSDEELPFTRLSGARLRILALQRLLHREATTARLVLPAQTSSVPRVIEAMGALACLGVAVEGVVVNRFPRRGEGWPAHVELEAQTALAEAARAADGVAVWKSTSRLRPVPKGRSALGPLGAVAVLSTEHLLVDSDDDGLWLHVPLPPTARAGSRVGVLGEHLVVDVAGAMRWIELPRVLTRCTAGSAQRTSTGLRVRFRPDPDRWPAPRAAQGEPS